MCYMNCPYENYQGECKIGSKNKPLDGYCQELDDYDESDGHDDLEDFWEDYLNE